MPGRSFDMGERFVFDHDALPSQSTARILPLSCTSEYSPAIITYVQMRRRRMSWCFLWAIWWWLSSSIRQFLVLSCSLPEKNWWAAFHLRTRNVYSAFQYQPPSVESRNARVLQWIRMVQIRWSHHLHWYWRLLQYQWVLHPRRLQSMSLVLVLWENIRDYGCINYCCVDESASQLIAKVRCSCVI